MAAALAVGAGAEVAIPVMDHASFYDGYLVQNIPDDAPDQGYLRLFTYLNSRKLTEAELDLIGQTLTIDVTIHAVCDNYDRIGSVNLAFIPKGQEAYTVAYNDQDPLRIEVARFITPFMNKNKQPDSVPYVFHCDNLSPVLRNAQLREAYDIWLELEVFGVPYAAQQQISGCAGCNHVFDGTVTLLTDDTPAGACRTNVFVPVVTRRSDWRADRGMNNYNAACTDEIGRTVKTYSFELPEAVKSSKVVIIMSNHGAGTNGEEYSRRDHFAYFDGEMALQWKPGRTSCETFRKYNTQANGIYGYIKHNDAWWQSFSNWCPGAPIPYRSINTGALEAGLHSVTIEVPDAEFYGSDGYFPVSIYVQGDTASEEAVSDPVDEDTRQAGVDAVEIGDYKTAVLVDGNTLRLRNGDGVIFAEVYSVDGMLKAEKVFAGMPEECTLSLEGFERGIYLVTVAAPDGTEVLKFCY